LETLQQGVTKLSLPLPNWQVLSELKGRSAEGRRAMFALCLLQLVERGKLTESGASEPVVEAIIEMAEARVAVVCEKNKEGWTQNRGQKTQPPAHEQGHTVPPRPLLQGSRQRVEQNEKHTYTNSTK